MSEKKKIKLKISYEVECTLDDSLYWEGATDEEMTMHEARNAEGDPVVYLDIGLQNETYKVEIVES